MKISSRVDYALSCVLRVADRPDKGNPVTVGDIAKKEKIESDYVERLCVTMKRNGILKSIRGKSGGYILARPAERISAKDVIVAIERNVLEPVCFRKKGRRKKCVHLVGCKIRFLWDNLKKDMELTLSKYTVDQLLSLRKREKNWQIK
ncbi:MAG: Rrf2 family transcriptional regulator [Candidatus Omnitrophica bacterium]|nr:Rrf2 family transcriptional regulator [Candidatus Omnitrophota bacterium]